MFKSNKMIASIIMMLFFLSSNAQTFPVNWSGLSDVVINGDSIERAPLARNIGVGTSSQILFGKGSGNVFEGSIEYIVNNTFEIKKLGFVVLNNTEGQVGILDYGFSFLRNGKVSAFSSDDLSAEISYSKGDQFKIARESNSIIFYINGLEFFSVIVPLTEDLAIRADLSSGGSSFSSVTSSFETTRFFVRAFIDNINKSIELGITGAYPPYEYVWENGSKFVDGERINSGGSAFSSFVNGNYMARIEDAQGDVVTRLFSVGENATYTNFHESIVTGNTLQTSSGIGWGGATVTNTFNPTSKAWTEYIINKQATGKKAFGISDVGTLIDKSRKIKAGFLVSQDNVQVLFNGNVVLTENYDDKDALNLQYEGGAVSWFRNGIKIYTADYAVTGNINVVGLVRDGGTLENLTHDVNPQEYVSTIWNVTSETGDITVDISSFGATGPFHYVLSEEPVADLDVIYQELKDSIPIDSLSFFTGSFNSPTHVFTGYDQGRYFINVFDSQSNRIFGKEVQLQGSLEFDQQSGLISSGTAITATNDLSYGSLKLYTANNVSGSFEIKFARLNGDQIQFVGLALPEAIVDDFSDLEFGFYLNGDQLYTVQNGILATSFIRLGNESSIIFELDSGILLIKANDEEVLNASLPESYGYKIGLGTVPEANMELNILQGFSLKSIPSVIVSTTPGSCFSSNGTIEVLYQITGLFASFYQVSPPTLLNVSTNTSVTMQLVDPGLYGVSNLVPGTYLITSNIVFSIPSLSINIPIPIPNEVVQVYSKINWTNLIETEYVPLNNFPQTDNISRNNIASGSILGSAQANHQLSSLDENALFFRLNLPNNIDIGVIRWTDNVDALGVNVYSEIQQDNFVGIAFFRTTLGIYAGTLVNGIIQGPYVPVTNSSSSFGFYYDDNTNQARLDEFDSNGSSFNLIPSYSVVGGNPTHIIVNPLRLGTGFFDVLTNMSCIVPDIYAKLERKLRGVKYKVYENELRFSVNKEYNLSGLLNYRIYSEQDRITPVLYANLVAESVEYGDNRKKMYVGGLLPGVYVLEVENDKKEKFYLRFIK